MSSQLEIQQRNNFAGQKQYRFVLSNPSFGNQEIMQPEGWQEGQTTYSRHKLYKSVLRSVSSNELIFYKKGREFLKKVYDAGGIDAECTMAVTKLNRSTYEYESYPAAGKVDFSTYVVNEISVKVGLVDNAFNEKILNRSTTELNLFNTTSIDGYEIANVFTDITVNFPDTSIDNESTWNDGGNITDAVHIVPLIINVGGDFSEARTPTQGSANIDKTTGAYFQTALRDYILHISGELSVTIDLGSSCSWELVHLNSSDVVQSRTGLGQRTSTGVLEYDVPQIILAEGDSLNLQGTRSGGSRVIYGGSHAINETYIGSPAQESRSFPYYEAGLRLSQLMSGEENPFYCEKFGRTDTPLTTYAEDGELGHLTKGIYLRVGTGTDAYPIAMTFEQWFNALDSIFNIGMGIEQIGGVNKVRVEELDHWFNSGVVADVSDRLREEDIETSVIPEKFFKSIGLGFNSFTYESDAGLFEFNTKSSWTTAIKSIFNDLKKISPFRADGQGMRILLSYASSDDYDPSEDVKGDDDIFLIDCVRNAGDFLVRTDEGFDFVGGSVYAEASFNLFYSPARSLRRWGSILRAGMENMLNTYLRWQSTDKNTTLATRLSTEIATITENADVLVNDLGTALWVNEKMSVKVPLSTTELNAIDAAPNQLIKVADNRWGWILEMKTANKDGMTEFELLTFNNNY